MGFPGVRPGQGGDSDPPHIWLWPFPTPYFLYTTESLLDFSLLICDMGHVHTMLHT